MATARFVVSGMHCANCQTKVEKALKGLAGVYTAVVDLRDGIAEVDFEDDAVTTEMLLGAVRQAGYTAKLAG